VNELGALKRAIHDYHVANGSDPATRSNASACADLGQTESHKLCAPTAPAAPPVDVAPPPYQVVLVHELASPQGPVRALHASKMSRDRDGVTLRMQGVPGRVFIPWCNIRILQDDT
jgi:hypothetical protein